MVKVDSGELNFYMDGYLKSNLDLIKDKVVNHDFDCIFCVDGYEGFGKTTLGAQATHYLDPTLNIDRMCFSAKEFINACVKAEKNQGVVYDEAITGLSARTSLGVINTALVKMLAQIRQKNLFICVIMPSFFDLDKYVSLWRSMFLLHVYSDDSMNRGFFSFYNRESKKNLYVNGKKFYSYKIQPNFRGRFSKFLPLSVEDYKAKKLKSLTRKEWDIEALTRRHSLQRDALIYALNKLHGWKPLEIAQYLSKQVGFDITNDTITHILTRMKRDMGDTPSLEGET